MLPDALAVVRAVDDHGYSRCAACHVEHGLHDAVIPGAAAEVARQRDADLLLAGRVRPVQQRARRDQHPGRAESALDAAAVQERDLERIQPGVAGEPLDRGDRAPGGLEGEVGARVHRLAVEQHHAGAALGVVAALLRAGQADRAAHGVEQAQMRVELDRIGLAVHVQGRGVIASRRLHEARGWRERGRRRRRAARATAAVTARRVMTAAIARR